jgi:hypothetical protein
MNYYMTARGVDLAATLGRDPAHFGRARYRFASCRRGESPTFASTQVDACGVRHHYREFCQGRFASPQFPPA